MENANFIKQITSKDINQSKKIIKEIIDTKNVGLFQKLCEKSDFIFPFLKERIIKDFISFINKDNLNVTFEFAKVYNSDFEEIILAPWVKFANENLTDEILELFEKGSDDEKCYCARYFSYIQDSLALEFLNKEAKSNNSALKINCARTLSAFKDKEVYFEMLDKIKTSKDDYEILDAYQFLIPYDDKSILNMLTERAFESSLCANLISYIKDFYSLEELIQNVKIENLVQIYSVIIDNYPENISLDTLIYYEIYDFIKLLIENKNQYVNNILYLSKIKFDEFSSNDIYSFDLDKNAKEELKNISKLLNSIEYNFDNLDNELNQFNQDKNRFIAALGIVLDKKIEKYCDFLANLINENKIDYTICATIAQILKELGGAGLINRENIEKIEDINIKSLILSYLN